MPKGDYAKEKSELDKKNRIGLKKYNNQNCLMKIIEYNNAIDIVVEFQDKYKAKVHARYGCFLDGSIKNPYYSSVLEVGMLGDKYPSKINNKNTKEYKAWKNILVRCYDKKCQNKHPTYQDATCCEEWLLFEDFYEWLHKQPNFDKWFNGERWAVDKDILNKGNKVYSPKNCCLVPQKVNGLFAKSDAARGDYPIGVAKVNSGYMARCKNPFTNVMEYLGVYTTPEKAFLAYKKYKEKAIKQMAQEEYDNGNITKECYEAMMNYKVEITD